MRLNPDCVRDILLQVEENSFRIEHSDRNINFPFESFTFLKLYSYEEVAYHLKQCDLMNFIEMKRYLGYIDVYDLYPAGHSFLANIRNENNWNKTKNIAKNIGSFSIDTLKDVASNVISNLITNNFK